MIIATAGHVDHGKTSLIAALTGVDTDRLPEEKARGLTIDLGFAYVPLPHGRLLGFVDVPGHPAFIANMLAGVGHVDHALIVVAADDGVMPQTREHVEILDLLGLSRASLVITKTDRVEAGRVDAVEAQVRALVRPTAIEADQAFRTSVRTGEGIPALLAHLTALKGSRAAAAAQGAFRLTVDRAFTLRGVGVVVTGGVAAGMVRTGETVTLAPAGSPARVRGLRIHDREVASVEAGDRCAMRLSGITLGDVSRGVVVTAGPGLATRRIEVELRLTGGGRRLRHLAPARLHVGAADVACRVGLLTGTVLEPGQAALAVLHLERPVAAFALQRFILRDPSAQRTLGGGGVLDPLPPARQTRDLRLARLGALRGAGDAAAAFEARLNGAPGGFDLDAFARGFGLTPQACLRLAAARGARILDGGAGRIAVAAPLWTQLLGAVLASVGAYHARHPERLGPAEREVSAAQSRPGEGALVRHAVDELCAAGRLARRGAVLHLQGHTAQPTAAEAALWRRVEPVLSADGSRPPRVREVAERLGIDLAALEVFFGRAVELGWVHKVAGNRYFLPTTLDALAGIAESLAASRDGAFTAADFNLASRIGRNLTIQVLEYFDRIGLTRRQGDRRSVPAAGEPATREAATRQPAGEPAGRTREGGRL